jgi:hypothetical protein
LAEFCHDPLMREDLQEELAAAIAAERAAWEKVKDGLSGSPQHVEAHWTTWQAAVERCRSARKPLDAAAASSQWGSASEPRLTRQTTRFGICWAESGRVRLLSAQTGGPASQQRGCQISVCSEISSASSTSIPR